jgi:hypothetical protein
MGRRSVRVGRVVERRRRRGGRSRRRRGRRRVDDHRRGRGRGRPAMAARRRRRGGRNVVAVAGGGRRVRVGERLEALRRPRGGGRRRVFRRRRAEPAPRRARAPLGGRLSLRHRRSREHHGNGRRREERLRHDTSFPSKVAWAPALGRPSSWCVVLPRGRVGVHDSRSGCNRGATKLETRGPENQWARIRQTRAPVDVCSRAPRERRRGRRPPAPALL